MGYVPMGYRLALFIRFYGHGLYKSDQWPTKNRVIPFRTFELFYSAMENVQALEQLLTVQSVAHGAAVAMGGSDPKVKNTTRALARKAYPEVPLENHGAG